MDNQTYKLELTLTELKLIYRALGDLSEGAHERGNLQFKELVENTFTDILKKAEGAGYKYSDAGYKYS